MTDTLSIADAVDAVLAQDAEPKGDPAPEKDAAEPNTEGDTDKEIPGDQPGTDEAAGTPAEDAGGADDAPEEVPAAEAPAYWSKESKAAFAALPPEAQAVVLAETEAAQRVTSLKLEETAAERKAAKAERERFSKVAETAQTVFAGRWDRWTPEVWAALAQSDLPKYTALKAQYDADLATNQQIQSAREEAEKAEHAEWLEEQRDVLAKLAPDLVDPVKGPENQRQLFEYLTKNGATKEGIERADAVALSIARKAMLYDAGVAKLTQPKPQPAPTKAALKPSAGEADSSQQRSETRAKSQFQKTGSIDDAVNLLLARQG